MKSLHQLLEEAKVVGYINPDTFKKKETFTPKPKSTFQTKALSDVVYDQDGKKVRLTAHIDTRQHRPWWDDVQDESFQKYLRKGLEILSKRKASRNEEYALMSKNGKRALIISAKEGKKDRYTNFDIMTILNAEAAGMEKEKIFIKKIDDKNKIMVECKQIQYEVSEIIYV